MSSARSRSLRDTYGPSLGALAVPTPDLRALVVSRSPIHYEDGDMRRAYRWTRAALLALLVGGAVALACRLVLTGMFVAVVTGDPVAVGGFNVGVTLFGSGATLALVWARRRASRHLRQRRARRAARPERL